MDRRRFLYQIGLASAAGTVAGTVAGTTAGTGAHDRTPRPRETHHVTYAVKGFTCITCAAGLEVMLRGVAGVTRANASYAANDVVIGFDEDVTNEKALKEFIRTCGFAVA
jgi:copper chaperone CopZ